MKNNLLAAAIVAGLPSITVAQGIEHLGSEFGLGYAYSDTTTADESLDGFVLSVKTDWALGTSFGVQLNGSARDFSLGEIQSFGVHGWYQLNPSIRLGGFAQSTSTSVVAFPTAINHSLFGIEALLEPTDRAAIQVYAGMGRVDLSGLIPNADSVGLGMSARYDFSPRFAAHMNFERNTMDISGTDFAVTSYGVGVDWRLNVAESGVPMVISVDYAHVDASILETDRISVMGKIMLGGKGEAPRNLFDDRFAPGFYFAF